GYKNIVTRGKNVLDLTDQAAVFSFFGSEKPEFVFLAAGLTGGISGNQKYPAEFFETNILIQSNVLLAARRSNVKNLVFYGSSCMYPKLSPQPIKEEYLMTGPIEPTSRAYAMAKAAGVTACWAYNQQFGQKRFIALVPNSIFGPHDSFDPERSHVISALIAKFHNARINNLDRIELWGSGSPRREFVYVDDAADASIFALENAERLDNRPYNVGVGKDYSIKELAEMISQVVGYSGKISWDTNRPDGTPRKLLDNASFSSLGWRPGTSFLDGLKNTYQWYQNNLTGVN
ncbi:MAG: GDP-L-fucose synthase, partial [Candidatus Margulisiibacteriota bacterium]